MDAHAEARKRELLAECQMSPKVFDGMEARLESFMQPFVATFCRREQTEHATTFVSGLLSDLDKKNVESIAYRSGQDRLPLQWFIGFSEWDDQPLRAELARQVGAELGEADGILVFDPSAFKKSGTESVGVNRQWCGRLGKVENCQVAVYMGYVSSREHALVDLRLYLPKDWTQDKHRCAKAGVPKERRRHRTRHQLCLEMLEAHGRQLPHSWIAGDDELGRPYAFRSSLHHLNERYLLAVPSNTLIRDQESELPPYAGRGRHPERPWQRVDAWMAALPAEAWCETDVRDGSKGPLVVEMTARRVVARTPQSQEGHAEMLVVIRYRDRDKERIVKTDYYLSNASPETELLEFARAAKAEHRIEECLQRSKSEAGLGDYEVRNWIGWHHHQTLSLLASWFLVTETRRGKKNNACSHAAATAGRHFAYPASSQRMRRPQPYPPRTPATTNTQRTRSALPLETP